MPFKNDETPEPKKAEKTGVSKKNLL